MYIYIYSFLTRACRKEIYIYTGYCLVCYTKNSCLSPRQQSTKPKVVFSVIARFPFAGSIVPFFVPWRIVTWWVSSACKSYFGAGACDAPRIRRLRSLGGQIKNRGLRSKNPEVFELKSMWKRRWKITMAIFEKEYSIWGLECLTKNVWMVLGKCREE